MKPTPAQRALLRELLPEGRRLAGVSPVGDLRGRLRWALTDVEYPMHGFRVVMAYPSRRIATVAHRREAADKARRYRSAQHGLQREKRRLRRRGDRAGMAANAELRRKLYVAWEAWKAART